MSIGRDVRAMAAFHGAFFACAGLTAFLDPPGKGWAVLALVVVYVFGLHAVARRAGRKDWLAMATFLVPVSIFQVLPDWMLARVPGILRFPDIGGPRLDDAINLAMAGMWVAPLFVVLALSRGRPAAAAFLALAVFAGSELLAPVLDLWEPSGDTERVAGVALYVLPAEAALGWATATAWTMAGSAGAVRRVGAAFVVSVFYSGALLLSHLLIDVAGWHVSV